MSYSLDANHHELNLSAQTLGFVVIDNARVKRNEPGQLDTWWGIPNPYGGAAVWVWVEYKTETGLLKPAQEATIRECQEAGLPVEVVRNTADVERVYQKYLAVMAQAPQKHAAQQANGADGQSGSMPQGDVLPEHVAAACCRRTLAAGWGEANWNRITKTNTSPYTTAIVLKYCQRWQMYGLL